MSSPTKYPALDDFLKNRMFNRIDRPEFSGSGHISADDTSASRTGEWLVYPIPGNKGEFLIQTEKIGQQIELFEDVLSNIVTGSVFMNSGISEFTRTSIRSWAYQRTIQFFEMPDLLAGRKIWTEQFTHVRPDVLFLSEPEFLFLFYTQPEWLGGAGHIVVVNPQSESKWSKDLLQSQRSFDVTLAYEFCHLPGISLFRTILATDQKEPTAFVNARPRECLVLKDGEEVSGLKKGHLSFLVHKLNETGEISEVVIESRLESRNRQGNISLLSDQILTVDGYIHEKDEVIASFLNAHRCWQANIVKEATGIFPFTLRYSHPEGIEPDPTGKLEGVVLGLRRCAHPKAQLEMYTFADDTTLQVLSKQDDGNGKSLLFQRSISYAYDELNVIEKPYLTHDREDVHPLNNKSAISEGLPLPYLERQDLLLTKQLENAAKTSNGIHFISIHGEAKFVAYSSLYHRAVQLAYKLLSLKLPGSTPVMLQIADQESFLVAYWGILFAGHIAIPHSVPKSFSAGSDSLDRSKNILNFLPHAVIIASEHLVGHLTRLASELDSAKERVYSFEALSQKSGDEGILPDPDPDQVAIYLFTSGSSGIPKCIQQTHAALSSRNAGVNLHYGFSGSDVFCNWMPLDHVGGIQMCHHAAVSVGANLVLCPPDHVLSDIIRWLDLIDQYRVTYTWAPNFAFAQLLQDEQRIAEGVWDLSSLKHWLSGGEAVSTRVNLRLLEILEKHLLDPNCIEPAYGMSETCSGIAHALEYDGRQKGVNHIVQASLKSTLRYKDQASADSITLTEVGPPIPGVTIRIADRNNQTIQENVVGRVQVKGPVVTSGYLNNPDANTNLLDEGWFNTGDLGFLRDGHLTITGRENDLIILNGLNHQNHEIERYLEEIPELGVNSAMVASHYSQKEAKEQLLVFILPKSGKFKDLVKKVKNKLALNIGIIPDVVAVLKPSDFLITESGKKRRSVVAERYLARAFKPVFQDGNQQSLYDPKQIFGFGYSSSKGIDRPLVGFIHILITDRNIPSSAATADLLVVDRIKAESLIRDLSDTEPVVATLDISAPTALNTDWNSTVLLIKRLTRLQNIRHVQVVTATPETKDFARNYGYLHGLLASIQEEHPDRTFRQIAVDIDPEGDWLHRIMNESNHPQKQPFILLGGQDRKAPALLRVSGEIRDVDHVNLQKGAWYLVTGALGGIGSIVCERLIREYGIKIFALGRTQFEGNDQKKYLFPFESGQGVMRARLESLTSDHFRYRSCDVSDLDALRSCIEIFERENGIRISGYFHLAGNSQLKYHWDHIKEHSFSEESINVFEYMRAAKVEGLLNLERIFQDRPDFERIVFGSVNGYFGGNTFSSYSAVNSFLNYFTEERVRSGLSFRTIHWTQWRDTGMSEGDQNEFLTLRKGFITMGHEEGWQTLKNILRLPSGNYFVGLDQSNPFIQNETTYSGFTEEATLFHSDTLSELDLRKYIRPAGGGLRQWRLIALTEAQLMAEVQSAGDGDVSVHEHKEIFTLTESKVAELWMELLNTPKVRRSDNFFELGGHSILATKLMARISARFQTEITFTQLFQADTLQELAELIDKSSGISPAFDIPLAIQQEKYRLSPSQSRIWMVDKLEGGAGAYLVPGILTLEQQLDIDGFRNALHALVERHEILRTFFIEEDGTPYQKIMPSVDLQDVLTIHDKNVNADEVISRMLEKGLDLKGESLFHCHLFTIGDRHYKLLVLMHHINADGTTLSILTKDLQDLYAREMLLDDVSIRPLGLHYKDFSVWYDNYLLSAKGMESQSYWLQKLDGFHGAVTLPYDREKPLVRDFKGTNEQRVFGEVLTARIEQYASQKKISVFNVLISLMNVLMHRQTGSEDILLGTSIDLRTHAKLENQAGQYVNVLPLRTTVQPGDSFSEVVRNSGDTLLQALEHKLYPYERLVAASGLDRETTKDSLVYILLVMHNFEDARSHDRHLKFKKEAVINETSKFDLVCSFVVHEGRLTIDLRYATSLFSRSRILHLLESMESLAESLLDDDNECIAEHSLPSPLEESHSRRPFSKAYFEDVLQMFYNQVGTRPDAVAVQGDEYDQTYRELYVRASETAHSLRNVGQHERIAVLLLPGINFVPYLLGVWMSGKSYVPIDAQLSSGQIKALLQKTGITFCLVPEDGGEMMRRLKMELEPGVQFLEPDRVSVEWSDYPVPDWEAEGYVFFTSGSTGTPKGIRGNRKNISHFIHWEISLLRLGHDRSSAVAQLTSPTFDACLRDVFLALCTGNLLSIPGRKERADLQTTIAWLKRREIHVLHAVPSVMRALCSIESNETGYNHLEHVLLAGEPLFLSDIRRFQTKWGGHIRFYNLYGPTETTLIKSCWEFNPGWEMERLPAGKGIFDTDLLILNTRGKICTYGELGEVHIRTPYMSLGYLDQTETDKAFIQNPIHSDHKDIVYKTGDMARYDPDGNVVLYGRKDEQVKLNGIRVELNAVVVAARSFPGVNQAAVKIFEVDDTRQLVLFAQGYGLDVDMIKKYLIDHLPAGHIPNRIVVVDRMPLSANGKVDQSRLTVDLSITPDGENTVEIDMDPKLLRIWCGVLKKDVSSMNPKATFFEAGGNSLMIMVLIAKLQQAFQVKININAFYKDPTLSFLAGICKEERQDVKHAIQSVKTEEGVLYPVSQNQRRLWLLNELEGGSRTYNVKRVFQLRGQFQLESFEKALVYLFARHEILRTSFAYKEEDIYQKVNRFTDVQDVLTVRDFSHHENPEEEATRVVQEALDEPFDLSFWPLVRVEVIRTAKDTHVIALVKHHIISDGWSMEVIARDLVTLYNQGVKSGKMSLAELPFQYKDFAKWQTGRIDSAQYRANADYWSDRFKDIPEPLELPYDKARSKVKTSNGALLAHTIGQEVYSNIRSFADSNDVSVFMVTLTAFKLLFYRYTGKTDITIGTPSAGRYQPGLEDQIGFFVNTLALRTQFDEQETFLSLLEKVKSTTIAALEHEDYPFDELIARLDPEKRMDHSPLFDVVVQFMNTGSNNDGKAGFDGLETVAFKTEWKTSQYDQTFSFTETSHGMHVAVEYNTDLFLESTIRREIEHVENILLACVNQPRTGIHKVQFLTREEQKAHSHLISIYDRYPEKSIPQLFREAVAKNPGKTAIHTSVQRTTFGELNDRVEQLSALLYKLTGGIKTRVGLLMYEGPDAIGSMISCLSAGQCYVPISPTLPYNRQKYIVEDAQIEVLLFSKEFLREAGQLYWECSKLQHVICLDSDNILAEIEKPRDIMSEELWDFVGTSSNDEITAGAWFSSYNGLPISRAEMDEYAGNAFNKLEHILDPATRVLEIGCASGLTMAMIAPKVHSYTGTDLSSEILEVAAKHVSQKKIGNVKLVHAAAHDVVGHLEGEYDVVIFNSVIQCFSGYHYFRNVVLDMLPFLSEKATILFGDLQDLDLKEELIEDLKNHARMNPKDKVKLDWSQELFLTRSFFEDLERHFPFKTSSEPSRKTGSIENELTRFRFDVLFTIDKSVPKKPSVSNWYDSTTVSHTTPTSIPDGFVELDDPAYIIYTSGSTGQPKGCVVSQRNMTRLFFNENHSFPFHAREVWMQSHGYHFDFSVLEIYGALLYGSTLVVPSASEVRDISTFYALIKDQKITVLGQTPQVFYKFSSFVLNQNDALNLSEHLRYIIFGGEKIIPGKLKDWGMAFPQVKLINMYGPTETTVHVTYHEIGLDEILNEPSVSNLGHPLPDIRIIIEDKFGNLVPFNVPAEIKIGGCGVGMGYFNREELTDERFIPYDENGSERMYISGDHGKINTKGELIFLARKDNQLKIRGYRIETAEIEAAMLQYPTIREAVVVDMKDAMGDEYLSMYYTGGSEAPEILTKFLKSSLPFYMVPGKFIHLDKIPLTNNGKLDRSRLTSVISAGTEAHSPDQDEWSTTQKVVAQAFREILDIDHVSLEQNFFESGGHSLKAMSLMSLLHSRVRVGVPLVYLYKHPTLKKIADYIDLARFMNIQYKEHPYLKLGDAEGKMNIILFPPVLGSALAYGHLADLLPAVTVYSFNYVDNNDTMQDYVRMIQEIQPVGKIHIAGHSAGGFMAFHVAKAMEKAGREVGSVIIIDAFRGGKEGKKHSLEFIAKEMDIYVEAKFEEFKSHFIDMEFFKEVCSKQVKQYYDFLFHVEQEGDLLIKAPIYLMKAENNFERKENWSEWTETGVTEIFAAGEHSKMVNEPYVRKNAAIIHEVLKLAENSNTYDQEINNQ